MDSIHVTGNGPLSGQIPIAGAKNACLTLMPATLLSDEPLTLTNAPRLSDIATMTELLTSLGAEVSSLQDGQVLAMSSHNLNNLTADYDIVRKMRASILVLGPMLARHGQAVVSLPGGCAIGARPVDLHLKALEAMGAELDLRDGYVHARAPGGLKGGVVDFPFVSVGATENALMAATLALIKSRMLLPDEPHEEEDGLDPRADLVQRLLEYQRFKEAAETLSKRRLLGRDVFSVIGPGPEKTPEGEREIEVGLFELVAAFRDVLDQSKSLTIKHEVESENVTVRDRMLVVMDLLEMNESLDFMRIFESDDGEGVASRPVLVATFLAVLELAR